MIKKAIVCDSCGIEKKESNHWFTCNIYSNYILFEIGIKEAELNNLHVCGVNCASKIFNNWAQERIKEETLNAIQTNG